MYKRQHDEDEEFFNPETADMNSIAPMVDDPEGDPDFKSAKKPRKTKVINCHQHFYV